MTDGTPRRSVATVYPRSRAAQLVPERLFQQGHASASRQRRTHPRVGERAHLLLQQLARALATQLTVLYRSEDSMHCTRAVATSGESGKALVQQSARGRWQLLAGVFDDAPYPQFSGWGSLPTVAC